MAGFNFAGIFRGAMSGFLRRNWLYLGFNALRRPALLKVPGIGRKLWTAARSLIGAAGSHKPRGCGSAAVSRQKRFGVLAIAVAAKYRGLAGAPLMAAAEEYARASGFGECGLSVAVDNHRAVRFYLKLGWEKELEEGTWKGRMRKRLSEGVLERA
jgi:GNAT superfamily N-acetyltransferase